MSSTASRLIKTPLAKQIARAKIKWSKRTNIVSPDLCGTYLSTLLLLVMKTFLTLSDDVIQRLAPSLAQHIGCTIIDINPGIGLWSAKLHDYLKPRNHILIEPKQDVCQPFLQPLLDAPGSRYRLIDWPDKHIWQPDRYVKEGLLHDAEGLGGPPPTTKEPNNSILIIANLVGQQSPIIGESKFKSSASALMKAVDYSRAARHRVGFLKYGPTRMLMWLSDEDKRSLLPRTVGYRGKIALYMEAHLKIEEIVGFPQASDSSSRREDALDIESSRRVAERMREKDIKIPPHRQIRLEDRRYELVQTSRHWHKELQELEEGFRTGKFKQNVEGPAATSDDGHIARTKNEKGRGRKSQIYTPEFKRMRMFRNVFNGEIANIDKINSVLKGQERIDKMDLDLHREDIKPSEREDMIKALNASIQDYKSELRSLTNKQLTRLYFLDDDRRAMAMNPPLLMWDRREAEPLLAREDEFHTPAQIALLDFQPNMANKFPMTMEQSIYFDLISTSLLSPAGHAGLERLRTTAPGAFEALVPQVPAIQDPAKGGRYDIDSVRARTMIPEIFHSLALAWDKWAFKPSIGSTMADMSTSTRPLDEDRPRRGAIVKL